MDYPGFIDQGLFAALKNGDPMAVKAIYEILLPWAERVEFSSAKLKEQLERKYGLELYAEESCDLHPALSGTFFEPLGTETTGPDDLDSILSALEEEKDAFEVEVFKHDAVVIDTTITEEATGETRDVDTNEAVEESGNETAIYNVVNAGYHRLQQHLIFCNDRTTNIWFIASRPGSYMMKIIHQVDIRINTKFRK